MSLRTLIRAVWSALAFVGLVIVTLNIERFAQALRLDQLLPDPSQASGILRLLQHPLVVLAAAMTVGICVGLWADTFIRHTMAKVPPKTPWEISLGKRMLATAKQLASITENGAFYNTHDRRTAAANLILLLEEVASKGLPINQAILDDGAASDQLLNYLTHVGMCLSRGDFAKAVLVAREFSQTTDQPRD